MVKYAVAGILLQSIVKGPRERWIRGRRYELTRLTAEGASRFPPTFALVIADQ